MRRITLLLFAIIFLGALLALDLTNRGVMWQYFWSATGEESPLAQVRGMVEWAGNFTRPQPTTAPLVPIQHTDVNPFGINTFLEDEVEPVKREQQVQMISDAGFGWIRQQFPWQDIEIHARGDFEDRRNVEAVGVVSAWDKYDQIVALAEQYGLQIQARLDNPPGWSHADPAIGEKAPPDDLQDFVNYAVAVAERYQGRIRYYQVWNEPNIYPEWGEQAVHPEAYTEMLCRTYEGLKAVDPNIVVISGALAPTVALNYRDLSDLVYLQRMYDAGAGACFDILSMQGYGLNSGPTDHRMRPTTVNFARNLYIRDIMVANGDAHKPIWISEAAWNPIDAPEVPPDVSARENYGVVTPDEAARFMPLAYDRMQREWPWIGVMNYWFFKRAADFERGQSWYYFRMVDPDFTPRPIYDTMRTYLTTITPTLYQGVHQADDWTITLADPQPVTIDSAEFGDAVETTAAEFTAQGTHVMVRWQGNGELSVEIDGVSPHPPTPSPSGRGGVGAHSSAPAADGWTITPLISTLPNEIHTFRITSDQPFTLDSITVYNRSVAQLTPIVGVAAALGLTLLVILAAALWERLK
jgi:polysaccharide biosynthesis protein PslG